MKGLSAILFGTIGVFGVIAVNAALKAANTADQLLFDFGGIQLKGANLSGASYTISLALNNPTSNPIKVANPFIALSLDANGSQKRFANTTTYNTKELEIKAHSVTILPIDIEISFSRILFLIPGFYDYMIKRLRGSQPTQKVLVTASIDSMGITIPLSKTLSI